MLRELIASLEGHGFRLYPQSVRAVNEDTTLFAASRGDQKAVGILQPGKALQLSSPLLQEATPTGDDVGLYPLTWENYETLRGVLPISPSTCDRQASFGTGDRLGLVSAAHLNALGRYPVFPVIAQQSPRELTKCGRDFRDVLLKAVMGVLESGYTGKFGADADHIKDEEHLMKAAEAGYSMYTVDVSDWLQDPTGKSADSLSPLSRSIVAECAGVKAADYMISEQELLKSALIYEKSLEQIRHFNDRIASVVKNYDLEVSIDEGARDTTVEDHLFAAEYLHRNGIDFTSLAPKFPGQFQKGVDYEGDYDALAVSLRRHAALCKRLGGYRLSLHSGSDKFSVYPLYNEVTDGCWHIKTSGTSWLEAVRVISQTNLPLFRELYALCLENLDESKKAYHVRIKTEDFSTQLPEDIASYFAEPSVRQLFHISYSALLDPANCGAEIYKTLNAHEGTHYLTVAGHIERHLGLLF